MVWAVGCWLFEVFVDCWLLVAGCSLLSVVCYVLCVCSVFVVCSLFVVCLLFVGVCCCAWFAVC